MSNASSPFLGAVMTHPMRSSMGRYHRRWWPGWTRVVDDGCGLIENFCRTLKEAERLAKANNQSWLVEVNDDARPIPLLTKALPFILSHAPTPIVSFISFRYRADANSLEKGERFRIRRQGELIYTLAMAVNLEGVSIDEAVEAILAGESKHDDVRFGEYVDSQSLGVSTHVPSLVQHHCFRESLLGNPATIMGRDRTAVTFPEGLNIKEVLDRYPYSTPTD